MKKFLIVLAAVVVIGGIYVVSTLNNLVGLDEAVKADWSQVLNQYQRRSDLIPNLVSTVKGYATHEQKTLTDVINARAKASQITISPEMLNNQQAMNAFQENQGALSSALSRLMAVAERYPDLKANQNFLSLQSQLEGTENRIAVARRDYIGKVRIYNTKIRTIPTKWVASIFGDFTPKANFDIEPAAAKVPNVEF